MQLLLMADKVRQKKKNYPNRNNLTIKNSNYKKHNNYKKYHQENRTSPLNATFNTRNKGELNQCEMDKEINKATIKCAIIIVTQQFFEGSSPKGLFF